MDGTPSRPALKRSIIVVSVLALAAIFDLPRPAAPGGAPAGGGASTPLPRLVDLGADKCVPAR
ncbi:MAG: hypothetical protein IPM94_14370 [bacterium]|nr:hypothetical protein [bacterium]